MIHSEGISIIAMVLISSVVLFFALFYIIPNAWVAWLLVITLLVFNGLVLWFFRNPDRNVAQLNDEIILAPCDGKLVAIEEVFEKEYYKDNRLKLSIFMSPLNVHVNRYPISGVVDFVRYHAGKYLVAWHPKSSELNERTTIVLSNKKGSLLLRQIAGAVARRIVYYSEEGQEIKQGDDLGFIKFGSRVDLYLPIGTKVDVEIDQIIIGNRTRIAHW